ncbi:LysR substrate-binding domain-containing protein [Ensifer sp. YR511]|uniref:LysR substrate-binding domain-containing protein n=1 Tax=Ensifer sp. YR511 TaxID=1855294 RepID=UPI000881FC95|nr:LysR substrate-binding domain-containing protein [Ensifer sp. YR511]SDO05002.1 transcriptional regulator, LysR family [Ensifer sp. YR511]
MLPPMNALVAFEAAARHESLTRAAAEMHVTPGAVGRQVKKLEDHLGLKLFTRTNRNILLTPEGRRFYESINDIFLQLRREVERVSRQTRDRPLNVRTSMMFMRYWLLPRLPRFFASHPDIKLNFSVGRSSDIPGPDIDLTIKILDEPLPGFKVKRLLKGTMIAVCSREYLTNRGGAIAYASLGEETLLHSSVHPEQWKIWLGEAHLAALDNARNIVLEGDGLSYEAAAEGIGIALARQCLVERELASGRLLVPMSGNGERFGDYYLVSPDVSPRVKGFMEFSRWLLENSKVVPETAKAAGQIN